MTTSRVVLGVVVGLLGCAGMTGTAHADILWSLGGGRTAIQRTDPNRYLRWNQQRAERDRRENLERRLRALEERERQRSWRLR